VLLEEIEAALQTRWDRETLEVYADALSAENDPRGALIALALAGTPGAPRIAKQRGELVDAWLRGFELPPNGHLWADTGFVSLEVKDDRVARAFMDSHLGPYLRRLHVGGQPIGCMEILDVLAAHRHVWCIELALDISFSTTAMPPIARDVLERIELAMPHLARLDVRWGGIEYVPASVKKLVLSYTRDIPLAPHVEELVLEGGFLDEAANAAAVFERVPSLRAIDLAYNETHLATIFATLDLVPVLDRVRTLRLPSIRTADDVSRIRALLRRYPELEIEVARSHRPLRPLLPDDEPRLRVTPPVPCPPADAFANDDALVIELGRRRIEVLVSYLAYNTETFFDVFSDEQQAALTFLWNQLETLGTSPIGFPGPAMARVAETMMLTDADSMMGISGWEKIAESLAVEPCAVMLARRP
jgi:hypothetical protein